MRFKTALLIGLLGSVAQAPLHAQQVPATEEEAPGLDEGDEAGAEGEEEIVVTGQRLRGAVIGDIPPEVQLDARDVRALGAGSIAEVLDALGPQTQSGRGRGGGRPVVLLNGQRISGFREIRNIPPEAIQRVDILPEEVALRYGYRADQRVVNFVLRPRFRALTGEAEYGIATDGGRDRYEADLNLLRINRNGRWEIDAEYEHQAPLFESERDLDSDLGEFRTLLPKSDSFELAGTLNRNLPVDISATVNATFEARDIEGQFGLAFPDAPRPLTRQSESREGHLGLSFNGDISPWRWSLTANYDRGHTVTLTDRRDILDLRDRAETETETANAALVVNGSILALPAGEVSTTFRAGAEHLGLEGQSTRGGVERESDLSRTRGNLQASLDVPVTSRRNDVLSAIGHLSANLNAEVERLSDFGTLTTLGYGINWSPIDEVSFIASVTHEEGAPSVQQLGNPFIQTPGVRVFDFTRGETVEVTAIEGGNLDLIADDRRVFKLGATVRPISETDLSITANYTNSVIENDIASFPAITAEIEAAFPERFERDDSGRLFRIDTRPVNFERARREELRWGINFSKPISSAPPPRGAFPQRWRQGGQAGRGGENAQGRDAGERAQPQGAGAGRAGQAAAPGTPPAAPPPAGEQAAQRRGSSPGGGGFRGFGGGRFGGGRGGRLQLALYHTWRFEESILIREGVPELDLLDGSALGSRGGRPRHEIEAQAGIFKNGYGARLTANWQDGTEVRGLADRTGGAATDLFFSDIATVNLRLFANLGEQSFVTRNPWLRGTRVSLAVNNIFNSRPDVRDVNGLTPPNYRPDFLDPLGRTVTVSIRKLLF